MAVQFRRMQLLASIAGACLCVVKAQADDWAQFRKDNRRSAASTDPIRVPLTEIWSYTNRHTNGHSPLFNCAVWKGRIFFVSCEGNARSMNCADARSGAMLWRRPLSTPVFGNPLTDAVAPAVSDDGVVYVYDQVPVCQCVGAGWSLGSAGKPSTVIDAADAIFEDAVTSILDAAAHYFGTVGRSIPGTQPQPPLPPGYGALLQTMVQMARGQNSMITFSRSIQVVDRTVQGNQGRTRPSKAETTVVLDFQAGPTTCVRTFAANTGEPGPTVTIPKVRLEGPVQQLLFQDIPRGATAPQALYFAVSPDGSTAVSPVPLVAVATGRRWMTAKALFSMIKRPPAFLGGPEVMGAPLINGREFSATNDDNMLVRWRVGDLDVPSIAETRIFHGTLRPGAPAPVPLRFSAFSPLVAGAYVLGSEGFARMMAALIPGSDVHYEIPNVIGGASGLDTTLYAGLGAPAGCRGIAAIEVRTGQVQWRYPAEGIPGEPASGGRQLPAHWVNPGVAVTDEAVFGEVNQSIVSLDRRDGRAFWTFTLPEGTIARSLVVSPKFLLVATSAGVGRSPLWDAGVGGRHELLALNRKTGKLVWKQATGRPGSLALSGGLMHLTDGALHTYAPAERTFRMAVNSSAAEDYRPIRSRREEGDGEQEAQEAPAAPAPPEKAIADATVVRLAWGESQAQMDAAIKERRTTAPAAALLLSFDRLDATRSAWVDAGQHPAFTEAWIKDYAAVCGRLAASARPEFFRGSPRDQCLSGPLPAGPVSGQAAGGYAFHRGPRGLARHARDRFVQRGSAGLGL